MAIKNQIIQPRYAIYNGDCVEVMKSMPDASVDLSIYSPPFATDRGGCLYTYSSSPQDLSNSIDKDEFFHHYQFVVQEIQRLTKPGRMSCVHTMDVPSGNTGCDRLYDFPGDIIRIHEHFGFALAMRFFIWKEPLTVRNRTMTKSLSHRGITEDSTRCSNAVADQLLVFRNRGENKVPVTHEKGLTYYAGEKPMPSDVQAYKNWTGPQIQNRFSHWIWRQYASSFWDDIRIDRVLPYRQAKEEDDEKHVHPLQRDVIARACDLFSKLNEVVLTPFMGVGSEAYESVVNYRKAIGIELKTAYYNQAVKNMEDAVSGNVELQEMLPADESKNEMEKEPETEGELV